MSRSLIAACTIFLWALTFAYPVRAETDRETAERCTARIYNSIRGKNAAQLLKASDALFNYEYAARRAASRNRQNWDTLAQTVRDGYLAKLRMVAKRDVIPRLIAGLTHGTVRRTDRTKGGLLVITYRSGSKLTMNDSCMVYDGSSAGVSISTLAANALKNP